jgi:hypothetical protein
MESIEDRIARAYQDSQQAAINLVFAELALGLTFCKITAHEPRKGEKYNAGLNRARMALNAAEKFMWIVKMRHPEFDQMMAQAERLRFELDMLEQNGTGGH